MAEADPFQKTAMGIVVAIFIAALTAMGVGLWALVQLVQWITSK